MNTHRSIPSKRLFFPFFLIVVFFLQACGGGSSSPKSESLPPPPPKKDRTGVEVYNEYCHTCHGDKGQGVVAPNLTDEYWIHGGSLEDIMRITENGLPDQGMIPYKSLLNPTEIKNVSAYILSLQGTNPPGGKAPEGTKVE